MRAFMETPEDLWSEMTIAVVGCSPVAMCSIASTRERKSDRIFIVDYNPGRLQAAQELRCAPVNFEDVDLVAEIKRMTDGNGVDAVIEGVGQGPALRRASEILLRPGCKC